MIYVFDSNTLIDIFNHYYPERFPSFWDNFNGFIAKQTIISVQEVRRELERQEDRLSDWVMSHSELFLPPNADELDFITEIFKVKHFHILIQKKQQYIEGPAADPFIIAKAKVINGCVVTQEKHTKNAAKIPNVCDHFGIPCINLEGFMKKENWRF
jgi:hypothetical protein